MGGVPMWPERCFRRGELLLLLLLMLLLMLLLLHGVAAAVEGDAASWVASPVA